MYDRRRRTRHRPRIHDEQDRRIQELGDVGRRGELPAPALAVEEPHNAFYHRDLGPLGPVCEERGDQLRAGEKGVEVTPRPAGSESVVGGVYEIRANLERRNPVSSLSERGHEAGGDRRFSRAGMGAGDDYTGNVYPTCQDHFPYAYASDAPPYRANRPSRPSFVDYRAPC